MGVDSTRPSVARMYDYYLGGKDNYAVDRAAADAMMASVPESVQMVASNREFLVRAVRYLAAEAGIRQFLDIGSGLPTRRNVHEVAQAAAPGSRVVYADHDPLAVVHGRALLAVDENTRYIHGDLREPAKILDDPQVRGLIDFDRPVAVLVVAILHFIGDQDDPIGILRRLRERMVPGSYLVISHILDDPRPHEIGRILNAAGAPAWYPRTREEILPFFEGFELIGPGLTLLPRWQPPGSADASPPEDVAELRWQAAGVGRRS
ncbi:SAM-dependent methyltransferase [Actinoplanes subtropicus]|uniref:SAM-dependent methyltransferase n=1 Tax=Actinoplanes subtropicus TaxID=543632 RepID=UPI0004C2CB7F